MSVGPLIPAPAQRLIDAINAGDSAQFLICFTEDGVVDDGGRKFIGLEAIAAWDEAENIGAHNQIEVIGAATDGDDARLDVEIVGDGYTGAGTYTFIVDGNLVKWLTIRGQPDDDRI